MAGGNTSNVLVTGGPLLGSGMTDLLQVVYARLSALIVTLIPGGLWHGRPEVIDGFPEMPYATMDLSIGAGRDYSTDGSSISQQSVLFNVYGLSDTDVDRAMRVIDDNLSGKAFGQEMRWATGGALSALVVSQSLIELPDRTEQGTRVWQGTLNLEFRVERNR